MRGRAAGGGRFDARGVLASIFLCMTSVELPAQLVITEDTVITETVDGGIYIEGSATVRIAQGGRVEGDINTEPGQPGALIVDGGVVNGSINSFFEKPVRINAGVVTGNIVVLRHPIDIVGGVVLGNVSALDGVITVSGGHVGGRIGTDNTLQISGGGVAGDVFADSIHFSGGRVLGSISLFLGFGGGMSIISAIDAQLEGVQISGRLLDGTDLGSANPFEVSEGVSVEIQNHPNALYLVPSSFIVGSCTGVDVTVVLASDCDAEGLSFALEHDPEDLAPLSVEQSPALAALRDDLGPEYWEVDTDPLSGSGITVAVIGSLADPLAARLPASEALEIARIRYDVLPDAPIGLPSTRIELVDGLVPEEDTEPVSNVLSCEGTRIAIAGNGISLSLGTCFLRGDANADGFLDLSDPITVLLWLFAVDRLNGSPPCFDALDFDDSGAIDVTDAILALARLFTGGSAPPAPFESCGIDPTYDGTFCDVPSCGS